MSNNNNNNNNNNNKSLREEIENILYHTIIGRYVGVNEDIIKKSVFIDLIIKAFEKRIDGMYVKHPNTAGIGHNECLDQIKKEILK